MRNFIVILLFVSSSLFISGFVSNYFEITKNLEIFNNIYRELNTYYVDPIDPGELMHSTIDTMLKRLDPYTKYIPESEIEDFRFQTTGNYGGIGATIRKIDDQIVIYEPYKNFPADKSGLKMGDILLEINELEIIESNTTQDVSELLKGTPGTAVSVKAKKTNGEIQLFEITREKIHIPSVPYSGFLKEGIGYVKLKRFTKNCTKEVQDALKDLELIQDLNALILDLRSNPGGLLNESINLANLFIPKNETVVTTSGKISEWEKTYITKKEPQYPNIPIIVLVNGASASASEIVAGAIQDLDRGVVVGNKTYGKGLVQQSRKLSYNSRLKVTVAKYYTPSGRCIQDVVKTQDYNNYLDEENREDPELTDSLKMKFLTKNGRIVYAGGGIDPDIKVEPIAYPDILIELIRENYIFKFGNLILKEIPNYNSPQEFKLSEAIYTEFINYLNAENFSFDIPSDILIEDIIAKLDELNDVSENNLKLEKLYENIDTIKSSILLNKKQEIRKNQEQIENYLSSNLITRIFYEAGRIEYSLKDDPYINSAISILEDETRYNQILSP